MTTGLPSAGIGGFFYLIGALAMPFKELATMVFQPDKPRKWRLAMRQAGIAVCILVGLWLTGLGLGHLISLSATSPDVLGRVGVSSKSTNVVHVLMLTMSLGLLVVVLSAVQITRLIVRQRAHRTQCQSLGTYEYRPQ